MEPGVKHKLLLKQILNCAIPGSLVVCTVFWWFSSANQEITLGGEKFRLISSPTIPFLAQCLMLTFVGAFFFIPMMTVLFTAPPEAELKSGPCERDNFWVLHAFNWFRGRLDRDLIDLVKADLKKD
jgi:hypothetical protein